MLNFKMGHVTPTTSFWGRFFIVGLEHRHANTNTKFEVSNCTHYEDMKSGANVEIGVVWSS